MKKIAVIVGMIIALGMGHPAGVTAEGDQTRFHRLDAGARALEKASEIPGSSLTEEERRARVSALLMMFGQASGTDAVGLLLR